jgi:hypothetical protein
LITFILTWKINYPTNSQQKYSLLIGDRFAFVQGRYGAPTEGSLRSPLVHDRLLLGGEQPQQQQQNRRLLRLTYWKASVSPSLDICLEEETGQPLRCVDSIQGPGQQQWVRRSVELPAEERPFRVVLKARNLLAGGSHFEQPSNVTWLHLYKVHLNKMIMLQ